MGKKKGKKAAKKTKKKIARLVSLILAGKAARDNGEPYHTTTSEDQPRYHNSPNCHDGKDILDKDIRPGDADRELCRECRRLAGTK
jgi:hypothetical protein